MDLYEQIATGFERDRWDEDEPDVEFGQEPEPDPEEEDEIPDDFPDIES